MRLVIASSPRLASPDVVFPPRIALCVTFWSLHARCKPDGRTGRGHWRGGRVHELRVEGEGRRGSSVPFAGQTHRNSYRNYVLRPRSRGSWLIPWMRQPNRDRTTPAVQPGRHNGRIAHRDKDLGRQLMSNDDCVLSTAVSDLVVKCECNSLVGASARGVN